MSYATYSPKTVFFDIQAGTPGFLSLTIKSADGSSTIYSSVNVVATDPSVTITPNGDGTQHVVVQLVPNNLTPEAVGPDAIPPNVAYKWAVQDVRGAEHSDVALETSTFEFLQDIADPKNISQS